MKPATLLRIAAGIAVFTATVFVLLRTGTGLGDIIAFASLRAHLLALVVLCLDLTCRGIRMSMLGRVLDVSIPVGAAVAAQLGGEAAAAMTPSRVGADAGRILMLKRRGVRMTHGGAIAVAEMMFEIVALLLVTTVVMLALPAARTALAGVFVYMLIIMTTTTSSVLLARTARRGTPAWFRRIPFLERRWPTISVWSGEFYQAFRQLGKLRLHTMILIVIVSAVHIASRILILPALLLDIMTPALIGPSIGWPMLLFYAGALVPAPGGGGAVELAFAGTLGDTLGARVGAALFWWRFYTMHLLVIAGSILFASTRRHGGRAMYTERQDADR